MKIDRIGQATDTPTNLETVAMTIDEGSTAILMANLTSLYADPALAVMREYSSNAIDSHIRAGVEKPVEVTTPNANNGYTLTVQDYGIGMSKDDIANIYSRYGLSTKTSNNDEIGGFGLGCKSALAITDRFDLVARKDGMETVAYIQKNAKGVGVVHFVSETPTTEPNGVKVSIPTSQRNEYYLSPKALQTFFVGYPKNALTLNGETLPSMYEEPWKELNLGGETVGAYYDDETPYGSYQRGYHYIAANIGGVTYDVQSLYMKYDDAGEFLKASKKNRVIINLPIGSVDLTPSREAIMETEKSKATLIASLLNVEEAITDAVTAEVNKAETIEEALKTYIANTRKWGTEFKISYRGIPLAYHIDISAGAGATLDSMYRDNRSKTKTASHMRIDSINLLSLYGQKVPPVIFIKGTPSESLSKNLVYYVNKVYGTEVFNAIIFNDANIGISPLFDALSANNVTPETVISIATEYRSEKRKLALAATKAAGGAKQNKTAGKLPAGVFTTNGNMTVMPVTIETLQEAKKIAYIHAGQAGSLYRIFPSLGWHYNNGGVKIFDSSKIFQTVFKAMPDYTIVFLPAVRKVEKFLAMFPQAIEVRKHVEQYAVKSVAESVDVIAHSLMVEGYQGGRDYIRIASLADSLKKAGVFNHIANIEDRNFMQSLILNADNEKTLMYRHWVHSDETVQTKIDALIKEINLFTEKYALLGSINHNLDQKLSEHVISYMNSIS